MPRSYANNSMNRSLGRVGMPVGSMPVSSSSTSTGSSGSSRSYVDNSMNRNLGRVGMPVGSMPVSSSSTSTGSSGSSRSYVDNSMNRNLGRVGMPVGSMPVSSSSMSTGSSGSSRSYVDNSMNRDLGRVGMPVGSMPVSASSSSSGFGVASPPRAVYKDNAMNRRLGRVGKDIGTAVHYKGDQVCKRKYVDNAQNRRLGRVGLPLGSRPDSVGIRKLPLVRKAYEHLRYNREQEVNLREDYSMIEEEDEIYACEVALNQLNHASEVRKWQEESKTTEYPQTSKHLLSDYSGKVIQFEEINLQSKIGQGGFGDVHFAKWQGSVVAVKKLRVQRVSKRRLDDFTKEVILLCRLDHPNVVRFIGACVKTPNLCIIMEHMQMSVFDALHVMSDEVSFSKDEKLVLMREIAAGLTYLHEENIAHCDMKSSNVLLNYKKDEMLTVKITDFGLSMMRNEAEMSSSSQDMECAKNIGTPRYSAPEILRGEVLNVSAMMRADVYSFSLVITEILCEEEPFYNLKNYPQFMRQVGENGLTPEIPEDVQIDDPVLEQLKKCWNRNTENRPTSKQLFTFFQEAEKLYAY